MANDPSEFDLVKAMVNDELRTGASRVVQTEEGSWLAHWHGVPGNTPPIEKCEWFCVACFEKWNELWRQIPPVNFIDWKDAARRVGPEDAERAYNLIKNHRPSVWERIKNVDELDLKANIYCKDCGKDLGSEAEALVEVR